MFRSRKWVAGRRVESYVLTTTKYIVHMTLTSLLYKKHTCYIQSPWKEIFPSCLHRYFCGVGCLFWILCVAMLAGISNKRIRKKYLTKNIVTWYMYIFFFLLTFFVCSLKHQPLKHHYTWENCFINARVHISSIRKKFRLVKLCC